MQHAMKDNCELRAPVARLHGLVNQLLRTFNELHQRINLLEQRQPMTELTVHTASKDPV
ncbi:hypothetical protein PC116_g5156 [Phytophthora cactorum]|uniref:Uncharacterized protein n=2 Tax=Phytophthora cactorum TaxID=29920 RepID=A0A8T1DKB5_9STRA|nr:hypothetical protein Pcac1_g10888 [Phytophthora cactorum]KAG2828890.1 hypothetical protein PC111_g7988 [Phytophthora cactorum]KAG2928744.1 hypothetical protein PC114_g2994 [Phytophthora cactorum]KAG2940740.1 hypothetical protein PC115_g2378 [Phytophthora cactorum]KAG2950808.1 hypothetical protein PC117_g4127 [Phytophthora cactorum]